MLASLIHQCWRYTNALCVLMAQLSLFYQLASYLRISCLLGIQYHLTVSGLQSQFICFCHIHLHFLIYIYKFISRNKGWNHIIYHIHFFNSNANVYIRHYPTLIIFNIHILFYSIHSFALLHIKIHMKITFWPDTG